MKMSIAQHESMLRDKFDRLEKKRIELAIEQKIVERMERDIIQYQQQIDAAKCAGETEFDRWKY